MYKIDFKQIKYFHCKKSAIFIFSLMVLILILSSISYSQKKNPKLIEQNRIKRDSAITAQRNLSPTKKKYQYFLECIDKLTKDSLKDLTNKEELKKYNRFWQVDELARITVKIVLKNSATAADTAGVAKQIWNCGGKVFHNYYGIHNYEISCKLPYTCFDKIAAIPIIAFIDPIH